MNEKDYEDLSFGELIEIAKKAKDEKEKKFFFKLANKSLKKSFKEFLKEDNIKYKNL